jgi:hypothetical protein
MAVNDVHTDKPNCSEHGSLIVNCKILLSGYPDYVVVFARRQVNDRVHVLAREPYIILHALFFMLFLIVLLLLFCMKCLKFA